MIKYLVVWMGLLSECALAQQKIDLQTVINRALNNNNALQAIYGNVEASRLMNNVGSAGFTPTISLNGGMSGSVLNSYQEFSNNTNQDRTGAFSNGMNASLNADWVVYDGGKMFAVKRRLNAQTAVSNLSAKEYAQQLVADVMMAYYDLIRLQEVLRFAYFNLDLAKQRFDLIAVRWNAGADSRVEYLMSKSEWNRAEGVVLQTKIQLASASAKLSQLMGDKSIQEYVATDSIVVSPKEDFDLLKKRLIDNNFSILKSKSQNLILAEQVREAASLKLPQIQVSGAYVFNRSQSQAGFLTMNRQNGINAGFTLRWNLFSGGHLQNQQKAMSVQFTNNEWLMKEAIVLAESQLWFYLKNFQFGNDLLNIERSALNDSQELVNIANRRLAIGKSTFIENIETQRILEESQNRYILALFNLKVSEINLLKLTGGLINYGVKD